MNFGLIVPHVAPDKTTRRRAFALFPVAGATLAAALVTGLVYYLAPASLNWTASQGVLLAHIAGGLVALGCVTPFAINHQRQVEGHSRWLLAPWPALKRQPQESTRRYRQRWVGHGLTWSLLLTGLSGLAMTIPAGLWLVGVVWLPGYAAYQAANVVHLAASLAAAGLLLWHLLRRRSSGRSGQ